MGWFVLQKSRTVLPAYSQCEMKTTLVRGTGGGGTFKTADTPTLDPHGSGGRYNVQPELSVCRYLSGFHYPGPKKKTHFLKKN